VVVSLAEGHFRNQLVLVGLPKGGIVYTTLLRLLPRSILVPCWTTISCGAHLSNSLSGFGVVTRVRKWESRFKAGDSAAACTGRHRYVTALVVRSITAKQFHYAANDSLSYHGSWCDAVHVFGIRHDHWC
jgi:hypothetical protein